MMQEFANLLPVSVIADLLGLDVGTVARGRQDLLQQDVEMIEGLVAEGFGLVDHQHQLFGTLASRHQGLA